MHHDIVDNGGNSNIFLLKKNFVLCLGPDFSEITKRYKMDNLPEEWKSMDLNDLIPVAKKFHEATLATRAQNKRYKEETREKSQTPKSSKSQSDNSKSDPTSKDRTSRI